MPEDNRRARLADDAPLPIARALMVQGCTPTAADALLAWAGLRESRAPDIHALHDAAIDRLADAVEYHLDTQTLLQFLS